MLLWCLRRFKPNTFTTRISVCRNRLTTGSIRAFAAQLPPRRVISEDDIEESFLKGSGPGGQKIVRTAMFPIPTTHPLTIISSLEQNVVGCPIEAHSDRDGRQIASYSVSVSESFHCSATAR